MGEGRQPVLGSEREMKQLVLTHFPQAWGGCPALGAFQNTPGLLCMHLSSSCIQLQRRILVNYNEQFGFSFLRTVLNCLLIEAHPSFACTLLSQSFQA